MAASQTCICAHISIPGWSEHHLDHSQQKEEFLVEQYTQVLQALEGQYSRIGKLFTDGEKESFEGIALGNLWDSIKEAMRQNEVGLTEMRRGLWKRHWEENAAVEVGESGDAAEEETSE